MSIGSSAVRIVVFVVICFDSRIFFVFGVVFWSCWIVRVVFFMYVFSAIGFSDALFVVMFVMLF